MLAAWTSEARIPAIVTTDASELVVTDQYGGRDLIAVRGGKVAVELTGAVQFFEVSAGATLSIGPEREFGVDVLRGRPVIASSSSEWADPAVVTSGTANPYRPWRSGRLADGSVDETPAIEVSLAAPTSTDRVAVASGSIVCCETGLRDYKVSIKTIDGQWQEVVNRSGQFWERVALYEFDPVIAVAVRVDVPWTTIRGTRMLSVNYTGHAGGLPPTYMGIQTESDQIVSIAGLSAWATGEP